MSPRSRVLAYGTMAVLTVAGGVLAGLIHGFAGKVVGVTLISLATGGVVLLVFYEVGLSEDRELAREERRRKRAKRPSPRRAPTRRRRPP